MMPAPDAISDIEYAKSLLKSGDATKGIAEARRLSERVQRVFEAFVQERKLPPFLHGDCYQEVWWAVWAKYEKGQGIDIEKYLRAWERDQREQRSPRTQSVDGLVQSGEDSARCRVTNGCTLGVSEEATYGGDPRDSLLACLSENTPRPKGEWRAADTRREADVADRMGYDGEAWIAYRKKMGKRNRRSVAGSQRFYSTLSDAGDGKDAGAQRRLWHPGLAPHRRKQVVRRKNARDIFWNPGACGPPRVPTPLHILTAKEDLVCPYCGKQLALDSAPRSRKRKAGGIILEDCKNRRWGALCQCGFWYICGGVSPN